MNRPTRRAGRIVAGIAVAGLAAALGLVVASPAYAGTYVATDAASLITAIGLANGDPGSTIQISPALPGNTITMSGTNPQLTQATTVVGSATNPPTIIGPITPAPIFQFTNLTGNLEIDDVKMVGVATGGDAVTTSGGSGSITFKNDSFTSFPHPAVEMLLQTGAITVTDCTFDHNVAGAADHDGAAISAGAVNNVTITGSTFSNNTAANHGGALFLGAANSVNISGSTFDHNSGGLDSGAIGLTSMASDSTWTGDTFTGNTSGAGATVSPPIGGAAFDIGTVSAGAEFLIDRSTFSGNSAAAKAAATSGAVGFVNLLLGGIQLSNSTMTGNSFSGVGPGATGNGIDLAVPFMGPNSQFNIVQSTLLESASGNDLVYVTTNAGFARLASDTLIGPGVLIVSNNNNVAANAVETRDTIAISTTPLVPFDISGTPSEISYSITSDVAKPKLVDVGSTQFSVTDAQLGALANNGGPTQTRLPLVGSPAIDTGDPTFTAPVTDQRGAGFARIINGRVDIGAVEVPAATATAPVLAATGVDTGATLWTASTALLTGALLLGAVMLIRRRRNTAQ